MGKIIARNYRGTQDWLAEDTLLRQRVVEILRQTFEEFGFEPLETPEIELRSVLKGRYGEEGDQLTYFFQKGKDAIGLRYDHTVPLARVVSQHEHELVLPYRRYAIGTVFRADKPQKGRLRRFVQCDFDIVGTADPIADAEVVALTYTALKRLGFDRFEIQICDRRLLNGMAKAIGAKTKKLVLAFLRSWDKVEKADRKQITKELKEAGASSKLISQFHQVTDQLRNIGGGGYEVIEGIRRLFPDQPLVEQGTKVLEEMLGYITNFGLPSGFYQVNPCLARGLDYYTGPIFETVVKEGGVGSITGGGRFDDLIKTLGGPNLPATGSSFGLERMISVMRTLGLVEPGRTATQVFVPTFDPESQELVENAIELVTKLRSSGISAELYMGSESIGKQLQVADRRGIPVAVFAGSDEVLRGVVTIKDLAAPMEKKDKLANQWEVPKENLIGEVKSLLSKYK